jgi:hypothetical protein
MKNTKATSSKGAEETAVDTTALAEMEENTSLVETSAVSLALGTVEGSIDAKDLIIPRMAIVQRVGPASKEFEPGQIVYNKETVLAEPEEAINLVVLSIKKFYEEWLPYDPNGPKPKTFATARELADAKLYTDWRNDEQPPAREVANVLVLVEKPDAVDSTAFNKTIGGKDYAIALWTLRGVGYSYGAKKIFSASSIDLARSGLLSGRWELATEDKMVNGNYVHVPILRLVGRNSAELVAEIKQALQ